MKQSESLTRRRKKKRKEEMIDEEGAKEGESTPSS